MNFQINKWGFNLQISGSNPRPFVKPSFNTMLNDQFKLIGFKLSCPLTNLYVGLKISQTISSRSTHVCPVKKSHNQTENSDTYDLFNMNFNRHLFIYDIF